MAWLPVEVSNVEKLLGIGAAIRVGFALSLWDEDVFKFWRRDTYHYTKVASML